DAGGFFPPIYLDDSVEYRVRLDARTGSPLFDIDPYVCQCGFLMLTSRPYPVYYSEALDVVAPLAKEAPGTGYTETINVSANLQAGILQEPIVYYEDWPPEAIDVAADLVEGDLREPIVYYDSPTEAVDVSADLAEGELRVALVGYQTEPEAIDVAADIVSGTLE